MSFLNEAIGRGLVTHLRTIFKNHLPAVPNDTIAALGERLTQSPDSVDLWLRMGRLQLAASGVREAQTAFENALSVEPLCRLARLGLACTYDEIGDEQATLDALRDVRRDDPRDPAVAFAIGLTLERMEQVPDAIQAYRGALDVCPQLRNAYERLASLALREGDLDEAAACYENLVEMEPDDIELVLTLGTIYLNLDRAEDAIEQFQNALLIEPESDDTHWFADENAQSDSAVDAALDELQKFIAKYPNASIYRVQMADIYSRIGEDALAVENYQAALVAQPGYLEATIKLATHHLRNRRFPAAARFFAEAVALNDRLMEAFVGLGVAQRQAGRDAEAEATFDLAAGIESSCCLLFAEASRLRMQSEFGAPNDDKLIAVNPADEATFADVLARHRRATAEAPSRADLQYQYGLLLRQSARFRDAASSLQRAREIDPTFARAHLEHGLSIREAGDSSTAFACFAKAFHYDQATVQQRHQLALLFAQPNKFRFAMEHFSDDAADDDAQGTFFGNLPLILQNTGLLDVASTTWSSLCDIHSESGTLTQSRRVALSGLQANDDS